MVNSTQPASVRCTSKQKTCRNIHRLARGCMSWVSDFGRKPPHSTLEPCLISGRQGSARQGDI